MSTGDDIAITPESATTPAVSFLASQGTHEFIRYFIASLAALLLDTSILWFLTTILGVPYLISGAIAFACGVVTTYILSITWVFETRMLKNHSAEFVAFVLIGLVGLSLNELSLWFFTSVLGFYFLISKIFSVAFVFTWNFNARRMFLFGGTKK